MEGEGMRRRKTSPGGRKGGRVERTARRRFDAGSLEAVMVGGVVVVLLLCCSGKSNPGGGGGGQSGVSSI